MYVLDLCLQHQQMAAEVVLSRRLAHLLLGQQLCWWQAASALHCSCHIAPAVAGAKQRMHREGNAMYEPGEQL
jgi:hypothetical protein